MCLYCYLIETNSILNTHNSDQQRLYDGSIKFACKWITGVSIIVTSGSTRVRRLAIECRSIGRAARADVWRLESTEAVSNGKSIGRTKKGPWIPLPLARSLLCDPASLEPESLSEGIPHPIKSLGEITGHLSTSFAANGQPRSAI